jgi:hypothetical protein
MSDRSHDQDAAFAERVGHVLRAPERLSDDFDRALVAAIRNDQPTAAAMRRRSSMLSSDWWAAPPALSRAANLALAASIAALVAIGAWTIVPTASPTNHVAAAGSVHDTVTFVRFVFVGQARSVSLVGDFNQWGATPLPLRATGTGDAWAASVPVASGRHEYAFIVDGKHWVADPFAPRESDEFDTNSSVITVGL